MALCMCVGLSLYVRICALRKLDTVVLGKWRLTPECSLTSPHFVEGLFLD
jgi:hypothetical protein